MAVGNFYRDKVAGGETCEEVSRLRRALQEHELQLHLFVEHSPSAMAVVDSELRYMVVSRRWLTDYRLLDQDIIGRSHYEVFPDASDSWKELHQRCLAGAAEQCEADLFPREDGSVDWVRLLIRPWFTAEGSVGGLVLFSEVITDRIQAERALRDSEELRKDMGSVAQVGGWELDPVTGNGRWTDEVARIHDLDPVVKPCQEMGLSFYEGASLGLISAAVKEATERGTPYDLELELVSARGVRKWVRTLCRPVVEGGKVVLLRGSFQDISERKANELKIERFNRLYSTLSQVNQSVLRSSTRDELFGEVCRAVIEFGKFRAVSVSCRDDEDSPMRQVVSHFDGEEGDAWVAGCSFVAATMRTGQPHFGDQPHGAGFRSAASFPLSWDGRVLGTFSLLADEAGFFKDEELRLLEEIAWDLCFALDRLHDQERRCEAEEALHQSEARYRLIAENSSDAIWLYDVSLDRYSYVSPSIERLLGYTVEEVLNQSIRDAIGPELYDGLTLGEELATRRAAFEAGDKSARFKTYQLVQVRKDGGKVPTEVVTTLIADSLGRVTQIQGVTRDISERVRAEEALRQQLELQNQMAKVATTVPGLICSLRLNPDGSCCMPFATPAIEEIFGLRADEVRHDIASLLARFYPEDLKRMAEGMIESSKNLTPWRESYRVCHPEKGELWVEGHSVPVREADGGILWHGFVQDIGERKRAEEVLRRTTERFRLLADTAGSLLAADDPDEAITKLCLEVMRHLDCQVFLNCLLDDSHGQLRLNAFAGITDEEVLMLQNRAGGACPCEAKLLGQDYQQTFVAEDIQGSSDPLLNPFKTMGLQSGCCHLLRAQSGTLGTLFFGSETRPRFSSDEVDLMRTVADQVAVALQRLQSERKLRESEESFRAIFETASIGMGQSNPYTQRFVRVNSKLCEITGYSRAELLEMTPSDITHPGDRPLDREVFQSVVSGASPHGELVKRYVRKDGGIAWVHVNLTVIRGAGGRVLRTVAVIEDITARRAAEEERTRLATALEQAAESVMITDVDGVIAYVNPAFEQISGYSAQEAVGQNARVFKSGKQDQAFYKEMWGTLLRGEVWQGRLVNQRKDGTFFQEKATISPVRDREGKVVNYVAIKLDVTREEALEDQFRQSQKLEAIGQLAGGVAHDFNNILTSIIMQTQLAEMVEDMPPELGDAFRQINEDADRAANLTRQLLLFSRKQVMQPRELDLNEVVTHLVKMLQRIIGEDVSLQLVLFGGTLLTYADAGMLDQVLLNLAVNARDAMPGGGKLTIETSAVTVADKEIGTLFADAAPGRYVCLKVSDTGCGIPLEALPRIFEPFFTTKETGKGTGLGLATTFGIVKQHQGGIRVQSHAGQGASFEVYLPALKSARVSKVTEVAASPEKGNETILLVEDDAAVQRVLSVMLKRWGYHVLAASQGVEALQIWQERQDEVSLLLTDLVMPAGISGLQLAERLRAEKPSLKVIFTSGYSPETAGREFQLKAGENFVGKPFESDQLLRTIRHCLEN